MFVRPQRLVMQKTTFDRQRGWCKQTKIKKNTVEEK